MKLPHLTFGKVLAGTAIVLIATTGTAYAAATITGADIVNSTVESIDIKNETILGADILNGTVRGIDVGDSSLTSADILNGSISGLDVLDGSIKSADVGDNSLAATDLAPNAVSSSEIVDFGLSNQDIGVLFAQVNATGTLANSSGGVTAIRIDTGFYSVDFGRDVSSCAFAATLGAADPVALPDHGFVYASDSGTPTSVAVDTAATNGTVADKPFQLVVVC